MQNVLGILHTDQASGLASHGISGDMNPLNLTTESSSRNLSRNECFGLLRVSADLAQKGCHKHANRAPCNFEAARMCGNWEKVVKKMIELGRNGVPAVRAYDTVKGWKSRHTLEVVLRLAHTPRSLVGSRQARNKEGPSEPWPCTRDFQEGEWPPCCHVHNMAMRHTQAL